MFTGGEPDVRLDQILVDPEANRPAMFAMLESFAVGTHPNFIISGCVVSVGGAAPNNTWSMTAGYIYLNDEILQVETDSGNFDSDTEFLAFDKVVTYNSDGDKTFIDATPRQTWQENRGVITVQGSIATNELDAINGEHINDKIERYVAGGVETADSANVTLANDTQYLIFTANGPASWDIVVPDPDDNFVFNKLIFIDIRWTQGDVSIEQADSTSLLTGISTNAFIILVNDGTATWDILKDLRSATVAQATAGTNDTAYMTPVRVNFFTGGLRSLVFDIDDWNMDTDPAAAVAHGLTYADIVKVSAWIRNNTDTTRYNLENGTTGTGAGGYITVGSTNISLNRITGGDFDTTAFNSTSYNRGWVIIWYV